MKQERINKKVTVQDIAKFLNISTSSVSRALNNHPRISKKTKDKVKQAALDLGYYPNIPKLMNPDKTAAIAVLIPNLEDEFYREIYYGIDEKMSNNKFQTFLVNSDNSFNKVEPLLKSYEKYGLSGIIHIVGNRKITSTIYKYALKNKFPLVSVFRTDEESDLSSVIPDIYEGVSKLLHHFKRNGIKKIALILEDNNNPYDNLISTSFYLLAEISEINISDIVTYYTGNNTSDSLKETLEAFLKKYKPQAVFVKSPAIAIETWLISQKSGVFIPDDLLIVYSGVENKNLYLPISFSLLKLPAKKMGFKSAEMLIEQISNPNTERKTSIVPVNFILKSSAIKIK